MKIHCRSCYEIVPASGIDIFELKVHCPHCQHQFDLPKLSERLRRPVEVSRKVEFHQPPHGFSFSLKWQQKLHDYSVVLKYAGFAVLILVLWKWVLSPLLPSFFTTSIAFVMFLTFTGALVLGGFNIVGHFERVTTFYIDKGHLSVSHKSFPSSDYEKVFRPNQIQQLFIQRISNHHIQSCYCLCARLKGEEVETLVLNASSYQDLRFVEYVLEEYLGIVDERDPLEMVDVEGEVYND